MKDLYMKEPNEPSVVVRFMKEHPDYELSYMQDDFNNAIRIHMSKEGAHFEQSIAYKDIYMVDQSVIFFIFREALRRGKDEIDKILSGESSC